MGLSGRSPGSRWNGVQRVVVQVYGEVKEGETRDERREKQP